MNMKEKTYIPRILSMDTFEKLKGLLKRVDIEPTDTIMKQIESYTEKPMLRKYSTYSFIINQGALNQLSSAFEALGEEDQLFLIREFLLHNAPQYPTYKELCFYRDLVIRAIKSCLLKEKEEPPSPFEIIEQNLNENMKCLFKWQHLKPEGNDAALFAEWMKIVLADPLFVKAKQRLEDERKQGDARNAEMMPDTEKGRKITKANRESIDPRKKVQRIAQGGHLLADVKPDLENRLKTYMSKGHSKKRSCELLAEKKDVYWKASYLQKQLLKK